MEQTMETPEGGSGATQGTAVPKLDRRRLGERAEGGAVILGPDDRLEGKLLVRSDVLVYGAVDGEVASRGDIVVEAGGVVKAKLECRNLTIRGRAEGGVNARQRLHLSGSGSFQGNARVSKLHVEDGATFNGAIAMETGEGQAEP